MFHLMKSIIICKKTELFKAFNYSFLCRIKKIKKKVGEGVYGEVFLCQNKPQSIVKIIPIEGHQIINQEKQKKFDEILSEILISKY